MCGILGYIKLRNGQFDDEFKLDISSLFVQSTSRGKHATGFATFNKPQEDGQTNYHPIHYDKSDVSAENFITREAWNDLELPDVLIGHTRWKTKGDQKKNENNHPILGDFSAVVHNGGINNDDSLFREMGLPRAGEVDSEIIVRLLEHYSAEMSVEDAIKETSKKLRGKFACAYITEMRPETLFLFRHDNPLVMGYVKELGVIVFASERRFIEQAFLKVEGDPDFDYFERVVSRFKIWYKELPDDSALVLTPEGIESEFVIEPPKAYTQVTAYGGSHSHGGRQTEFGFQGSGGTNSGNATTSAGETKGSEDATKDAGSKSADTWWAKQYVRLYTCPHCKNLDEFQNLINDRYLCSNKSCGKSLVNYGVADLDTETLERKDWEALKSASGPDGLQKVF